MLYLSSAKSKAYGGLLGCLIVGNFSSSNADEILIDNNEALNSGHVSAQLVTIRPVTTTAGGVVFANTRITKDLIVRSATSFAEVNDSLEQAGISDPSEMPMDEFVNLIRGSDYPARYLYRINIDADTGGISPDSLEPGLKYPVTMSNYRQDYLASWDAKTLTNMVVTGVIDTDTLNVSSVEGKETQWYSVDDEYAKTIADAYSKFWFFQVDSPASDLSYIFASIKDDVVQYDQLQRSILENIGEITFGIPIIYTAAEKNLSIPISIAKTYDVYWADLVVTFRDLNPDDVAEMVFNVTVPEHNLALKLIPLRYGVEVNTNLITKSPEVSVEHQGAKVSVGEFFSQSVAYRYLKPTIEAAGEGERSFSWKITGEAISTGSHRFAVIIGVPKGTSNTDFAFSGHVRLRKSFIGEWYDGELVAGTDSWVVPVSF